MEIHQLERSVAFLSDCPHPDKVVFRSAAKARKRARQLHMRWYKCVCGNWHLTTPVEKIMITLTNPDTGDKHVMNEEACEELLPEVEYAEDNKLSQFQFRGMFIETGMGRKILNGEV